MSRSIRRLRMLVVVGSLFSLTVGSSCGGSGGHDGPARVALSEVVAEIRAFVDESRPTRANNEFPGENVRRLDTRLWYSPAPLTGPACRDGRCALVVLAHGFGGSSARFDSIGERLAAAGYVVAAVSFPLTNDQAPGGHLDGLTDVAQQPADVSAVIDAVLVANETGGDALEGRIDPGRIAALGHSLGGTTLAAATRVDCCRDSRIGATIYVEPGILLVEPFFGAPFASAGPPTLTFHGELDVPFPPSESRDFHAALAPPRMLVEMVGGNHVNMIERFRAEPDPLLDEAAETMIAFLDRYLGGDSSAIEPALSALRTAGHSVDYVEP